MEAREEKTFEMPAMPQLPDGIGLNHDQVAQLLAEKSKTIVSPDDPVLMMVTLCNAFLAEENKLMTRHKEVLAHVLAEKTDGFVQAVRQVADRMGQTLASSTVDAMRAALEAHRRDLQRHRRDMVWLSAIIVTSALINVAVFVLR
jgi:hypothetical protein